MTPLEFSAEEAPVPPHGVIDSCPSHPPAIRRSQLVPCGPREVPESEKETRLKATKILQNISEETGSQVKGSTQESMPQENKTLKEQHE